MDYKFGVVSDSSEEAVCGEKVLKGSWGDRKLWAGEMDQLIISAGQSLAGVLELPGNTSYLQNINQYIFQSNLKDDFKT